jgi:hypothetical protein
MPTGDTAVRRGQFSWLTALRIRSALRYASCRAHTNGADSAMRKPQIALAAEFGGQGGNVRVSPGIGA